MRSATPIKIVFIGRIIEKTHVKKFSTLKSVIFFPHVFSRSNYISVLSRPSITPATAWRRQNPKLSK
jgi:hypothetical protein